MNTHIHHTCPVTTTNSTSTSNSHSAKPATGPEDDGVFTIDDIICPFQRAAFNEGVLETDANGNVTNLKEVLKDFAGANFPMRNVAYHAAKKLTAGNDWDAAWADSYNLQDLAGSSLDHKADTQILRGGFNQERLDRALSFSSDGQRLTLSDLRRFQKANLEEEPGLRDEIIGGAEFALLMKVFGRTDGNGVKFIKNDDFVTLFRDAKWPAGWVPPDPGSLSVWSTGVAVTEYFAVDGAAEVSAAQNSKQGAQSCPFIEGQSFDVGEAAKYHADKLE